MRTAEQIRALRGRVEAATGPDRELDGWLYLRVSPKGQNEYAWPAEILRHSWPDWIEHWKHDTTAYPAYTASLDAALALMAAKLPNHRVFELRELVQDRGGRWQRAGWDCEICTMNGEGPDGEGEGATAPLAILSALLSALERESSHAD